MPLTSRIAALVLFVSFVHSSPVMEGNSTQRSLIPRAQVLLADGTSNQYGTLSSGLQWQATGILYQGCKDSTTYPIHITDCYALRLSSDASENLDEGHLDSPRQRIEFLTPKYPAGTTQKLKWRYYLSSQTGTSSSFFHLFQLKDQEVSAPYITLSAVTVSGKSYVKFDDNIRTGQTFPSIPLADFTDRTTVHFLTITYGPNGKMVYVIKDVEDESKEMLRYEASGVMGQDASFVKFGMYRKAYDGMTIGLASLGDVNGL